MGDEEAFQNALDADPTDWTLRLIFADWLQDRGDERAEGMRALGLLQVIPQNSLRKSDGSYMYAFTTTQNPVLQKSPEDSYSEHALPDAWFAMLRPLNQLSGWQPLWWSYMASRRMLFDTAARLFRGLLPDVRAELLKQSEPVTV